MMKRNTVVALVLSCVLPVAGLLAVQSASIFAEAEPKTKEMAEQDVRVQAQEYESNGWRREMSESEVSRISKLQPILITERIRHRGHDVGVEILIYHDAGRTYQCEVHRASPEEAYGKQWHTVKGPSFRKLVCWDLTT